MKKLFLFLSITIFSMPGLYAQTYDDIVSSSNRYIYSEASSGKSVMEADKQALASLSDQIIVHVSSAISLAHKKEGHQYHDENTSIVESYSSTSLTFCKRMILENGPKVYRVLRYMEMSELQKMFKDRELKVISMIDVAQKAEKELKIDQALKYYYWALCLCRTLIYPNSLKYCTPEGEDYVVLTWLPSKIQDLMDGVEVTFDTFLDEEKTEGRLNIDYKGQPISSLDYSYFDGIAWSSITSANSGIAAFELRADAEVSQIQFKIEYTYESEAHVDMEVSQVLSLIDAQAFKESFKNVPLKRTEKPSRKQEKLIGEKPREKQANTQTLGEFAVNNQDLNQVISAIKKKDYACVQSLFTEEGYKEFNQLICYGKAKVLADPVFKSMQVGDFKYFRSVPMQFSFSNNEKVFIENVVFCVDNEGKIDGINFALEQQTIDDIISKPDWDDYRKAVLINFLESYKTAFALARKDYLESIFSDDALIIVGQVVKPVVVENQIKGSDQVVYHRYTKGEYMKNLERSFDSKEYINIKFANLDISRMAKGEGEIFCVQIKQDYYSSNYGDSGYLCLLLDLEDPQKPIIHVRAWQPKPDENFGIFGPGDF